MAPVVYHPRYLDYWFGPQHPFSPLRQRMLIDLLETMGHAFDPVLPQPATREEIRAIHSEAYVQQVEAASTGCPLPDASDYGLETMDVPTFQGMDTATRYLVGGTLHAARMVADGSARRVLQLGGGLHHAQHALASGFCVYNDLSAAIRHFEGCGLRVAYIDVDVHHGDGVQWLHYSDPALLNLSLHESGRYLFPGTGTIHEIGDGAGKGLKLNVPLEPGTSDDSYLEEFERVVPHALAWFGPDVLLIQAGADAHLQDPLAHLRLSTHAYEALFRRLIQLSDAHTEGRAVFTLGGGYDFDAATRVWALLYFLLQDEPLPGRLPQDWLDRWRDRLQTTLTPTLHDPEPTTSSGQVVAHNRQVTQRLLETVVPCWS
ncbi:MAG TPA: acetoin utilization protein AcuC [Rhodothermales bacterium]|nr:acetoin utilization protein AcuC [Rhodothermales bacterium]